MPSATRNDVLKRLRKKGYLETIPKKEKLKGKGRYYFDLSGLFVALEYHIDHGLHLTKDHLKEETEIRTTTNTQGAKDMSSLMEEKYGFQTTQQKPTG